MRVASCQQYGLQRCRGGEGVAAPSRFQPVPAPSGRFWTVPEGSVRFYCPVPEGSEAGQGSASCRPWHLMGTDVGRSRSPLPVRERSRAVAIPAPQPAVLLGWEGEAGPLVTQRARSTEIVPECKFGCHHTPLYQLQN